MFSKVTAQFSPIANQLLEAMPLQVRENLFRHLERHIVRLDEVLHESCEAIDYVYFPIDAIVSLRCILECGACDEILLVGKQGMVGHPALLHGDSMLSRAVVQSEGAVWRIPTKRFRHEVNRNPALESILLRYSQAMITQIAQTAACNRHHSIVQQLCRRLLLTLDNGNNNQLKMTQASIASTLGVRREGITEAVGKLQRLRIVECSRGLITVLDRPTLENLSCECYAVVKKDTERLLGWGQPIAANVLRYGN